MTKKKTTTKQTYKNVPKFRGLHQVISNVHQGGNSFLVGMKHGLASLHVTSTTLTKIHILTMQDITILHLFKITESHMQLSIGVLFAIAQSWKQSICPSVSQ